MAKEKILLVDDSKMVLTFHSKILEKAGYEFKTAENGLVAYEIAMGERFDLVVTDVNMPKMDGYTLASKLRKLDEYKETPIIMVSTEKETIDASKGVEAGASAYLIKPVQANQLLMQMDMLLAQGRKAAS